MSSPKCTEEEQEQVIKGVKTFLCRFIFFYQDSNALSKTSMGESLSITELSLLHYKNNCFLFVLY